MQKAGFLMMQLIYQIPNCHIIPVFDCRRRTCGIHAGGNDDELHGRILVKDEDGQTERSRHKRQSASQYLGPRTTCQMMIVADYTFFENMGGSSASQTASYLVCWRCSNKI